jgi:hypothetical protein
LLLLSNNPGFTHDFRRKSVYAKQYWFGSDARKALSSPIALI